MRVLHAIWSEERIVCRGQYQYLVDGKPNGHVESWQISRLDDGREVVRADIDGRGAGTGPGLVTHLVRRPNGRPAWLRLRYQQGRLNAVAQYNFEDALVRVARRLEGGTRRLETVEIAAGYEIDYHPVIAHDYPWRGYPPDALGESRLIPVFSPDLWAEDADALCGRAIRVQITEFEAQPCSVPAGDFAQARHFSVYFDDGVEALAWFDQHGVPLRWSYPAKKYDFVLYSYSRAASAHPGARGM